MKSTTKLSSEQQQLLIDLNIKIYYVNEEILTNKELFKEAINEIERLIYKSKTLKYFKLEKQIIKNLEDKYDYSNNKEVTNKLINDFLKLLKEKDEITYEHVKNVSSYVDIFLDGLPEDKKLSEEEINILKKAALIHDVGKLAIPNQILKKNTSLDNNEYHDIKKHVSANAYLFNSKLMNDYKDIVLAHHERYDGKGYPKGLKGEEIPYFSRIISVLDTFEAMTGKRGYIKNKKSLYDVLNVLIENSGTQFDPNVVEYFVKGVIKNPEFQMNFDLKEGRKSI
jgi:HD-GYP domain-containing protein (c-di-GMP phosphodiesterase class II)